MLTPLRSAALCIVICVLTMLQCRLHSSGPAAGVSPGLGPSLPPPCRCPSCQGRRTQHPTPAPHCFFFFFFFFFSWCLSPAGSLSVGGAGWPVSGYNLAQGLHAGFSEKGGGVDCNLFCPRVSLWADQNVCYVVALASRLGEEPRRGARWGSSGSGTWGCSGRRRRGTRDDGGPPSRSARGCSGCRASQGSAGGWRTLCRSLGARRCCTPLARPRCCLFRARRGPGTRFPARPGWRWSRSAGTARPASAGEMRRPWL